MKITVFQQDKQIKIIFKQGTSTWLSVNLFESLSAPQSLERPERSRRIDNYVIDKADDFLLTLDRVVKIRQRRQRRQLKKSNFYYPVDRFLKKSTMDITVLKKANLKFVNVSILTERIIRAIIAGLEFSTLRGTTRRGK